MTTLLLPPRVVAPVPKPPTWLKGDWRFGIGVGAILFDLSRYRAHGTISGADWATGAHGKCLDFDSSVPDYVEIPASYDQLDFTSGDFSVVLRAFFNSLAVTVILYCRGYFNADGYYSEVWSGGEIGFVTHGHDDCQWTYSSAGDIATGTWYTIGMSRSGASVRLYRNGVDLTKVAATHVDPVTSSRSMKIGVYDDKSFHPFDGKMEFLRIFGRALPASEHLAYHNALA